MSIYGQVIDMRTSGQPIMLQVTDATYDTLSIACDEFLGGPAEPQPSGQQVSADRRRNQVRIERDRPRRRPGGGGGRSAGPTGRAARDGMQFSMVLAEAVLGDQSGGSGSQFQGFMHSYLKWLARFIPSDVTDQQLLGLRIRALDLAS